MFTQAMILSAVMAFAGTTESAATAVEARQVELNIVAYANAERKRHGLPPLELCPVLLESARKHSYWMASTRSMVHTSAQVAENIAMGQRDSLEAVRSWMNSPGHRANILNPRHRRIGAAAFQPVNGQIYWCMQLLQ